MRRTFVTAAAALSLVPVGIATAAEPAADPLAGSAHFVPMPEIIAPIFGPSRPEGSLAFTLVIETTDPAAAAAMNRQMPQLRAASLASAMEFARLHASGYMPVDVARLSAELTTTLKRTQPGITRVLIVKVAALPA